MKNDYSGPLVEWFAQYVLIALGFILWDYGTLWFFIGCIFSSVGITWMQEAAYRRGMRRERSCT